MNFYKITKKKQILKLINLIDKMSSLSLFTNNLKFRLEPLIFDGLVAIYEESNKNLQEFQENLKKSSILV